MGQGGARLRRHHRLKAIDVTPTPFLHAPAAVPHSIQVVRDIVYGHARVGCTGEAAGRLRPLLLDRYAPADAGTAPRPVLVLAFGGAFHRGSKSEDAFGTEGERNTSIADHCRMLAQQGYVACSIDYRLVQEDPDPGATRAVAEPAHIPRSRVDLVRSLLGLPPATSEMLWRGIEAASDDVAMAARFVLAQARSWNIDPRRLALGGFSAGARSALNAVYAEKVPAAAVFALSGYMDAEDQHRHLASHGGPPVLLVSADGDLDYIAAHAPGMAQRFRAHGVVCETVCVRGAGHFYPHDAAGTRDDGQATTVSAAIQDFLQRHMPPGDG